MLQRCGKLKVKLYRLCPNHIVSFWYWWWVVYTYHTFQNIHIPGSHCYYILVFYSKLRTFAKYMTPPRDFHMYIFLTIIFVFNATKIPESVNYNPIIITITRFLFRISCHVFITHTVVGTRWKRSTRSRKTAINGYLLLFTHSYVMSFPHRHPYHQLFSNVEISIFQCISMPVFIL